MVGSLSRRAKSGQEAFKEGRNTLGGPFREPGGVRRLNRRAGRGREAFLESR